MLNLLKSASDDQTAIGACILVLGVSALFVFVSFHLGPAGQKLRARNRSNMNLNPRAPFDADRSRERAA
jgi:hypothetical protein